MYGSNVLAGELAFISLADLFQLLGSNASTGVLTLTSQYVSERGMIYFVDGNPINARNGGLKGIEAINALFGWLEGRFEFKEAPVQIQKEIKASRMQIVLDALRLFDDGVIKKIGPPVDEAAAPGEPAAAAPDKASHLPIIRGPMIDYMYVVEEENFHEGKQIVTAGRHGSWIWVILEGVVEIIRETPKGPMAIARLGEGSFIGTLTVFLFDGNIRSANVNAIGNVRLGLLDTQRLYGEYTALSADFRKILMSLTGRMIKITDTAAQLYSGDYRNIRLPQDSKPIVKMGSSAGGAFIVTAGEAYLIGKSNKGAVSFMTLGKEDFFGNLPFLDMGQEPDSAAVFGSPDLKVTKLNPQSLQEQFDRLSITFRSLISNLCTSISLTTSVARQLKEKS